MTWQVKLWDRAPYVIPASDLKMEAMGDHVVATLLDENGPVAVFVDPESVVLIKDDPSNN